jgi:hypothetical protein
MSNENKIAAHHRAIYRYLEVNQPQEAPEHLEEGIKPQNFHCRPPASEEALARVAAWLARQNRQRSVRHR